MFSLKGKSCNQSTGRPGPVHGRESSDLHLFRSTSSDPLRKAEFEEGLRVRALRTLPAGFNGEVGTRTGEYQLCTGELDLRHHACTYADLSIQ
jgi:hypothetical protein